MKENSRAGWLDGFIFYALLTVIALTAIPYGALEPWWMAAFESCVLLLAALGIIEGLLRGQLLPAPAHRRLLLPLVGLCGLAYAQTVPLASFSVGGLDLSRTLSFDPYETRLVLFEFLALTLTTALLLRYTNSERRLRALIYLIIIVAVMSAVFGLLRQTLQRDEQGFVLPYLLPNEGFGQFINRNHFALLMEMALGLVLGLIAAGGIARDRWLLYLSAVMPVWLALVLTRSRGGIFSMIVQLLFVTLIFMMGQARQERAGESRSNWLGQLGNSLIFRAALIVCLLAVIFLGVIWVGGDRVVDRLESISTEINQVEDEDRSGVSRVDIWRATWQVIASHPVAGTGFGGYWAAVTKYHNASGASTPQQAHNDYLELLASGGIIGFALFAWFLVMFGQVVRSRLHAREPFRRAAVLGALAGLLGVAVHSLVDFGLHIPLNALLCVTLLVIATADYSAEHN